MLTFILKCGSVAIRCEASCMLEAFDYGFEQLGHLNQGIACLCVR